MHELELKLNELKARYDELNIWLSQPDAMSDQALWRKSLKEQADLDEVMALRDVWLKAGEELTGARGLLESGDEELKALAQEEIPELEQRVAETEDKLKLMLAPRDPNDDKNVVMEIRAGTGGEEAALFAMDLLRMYTAYAANKGWRCELADISETEIGGCKEAVMVITGQGAFSRLKYESGAHRVQRVPDTEAGGRIHTSAATVAVLPEAEEVELNIDPQELRIDVYRSSGAGGQHVNKTESAVRIVHIPTNIVVTCQDEKSQIKNRERAMTILRSRLLDKYESDRNAEYSANRRTLIGSGDRSERIRTYNFPQNRVTDHRIGYTIYQLEAFMGGNMDDMMDRLAIADRTERMQASEKQE
jgi:peptide chain release factor 1